MKCTTATRGAALPAHSAGNAKREIEEHDALWRGITLRITWEPDWLITQCEAIRSAHLTIESVSPARAPLPITETGYLSWFVLREEVAEAGGPVAIVLQRLEAEASGRVWLQVEAARRQLSLFD